MNQSDHTWRRRSASLLAVAAGTLAFSMAGPVSADTHTGKTIGAIHPPSLTHDCVYFTLSGVSVADATVGSTWFAIDRNNPGFGDIYILLLTVKQTSLVNNLNVGTTGSAVCGGHAQVSFVYSN